MVSREIEMKKKRKVNNYYGTSWFYRHGYEKHALKFIKLFHVDTYIYICQVNF